MLSYRDYSMVCNSPAKEGRGICIALHDMRNIVTESSQNLGVRIKFVMMAGFRDVADIQIHATYIDDISELGAREGSR